MIYKYFITSEIQDKIEKWNLGTDIMRRLKDYLSDDKELSASGLVSNILISKVNTSSGPRFMWCQEIRKDVCLYILRRIYKHDEYKRKVNDATKKQWERSHALSDKEKEEVSQEFSKYFKEAKKDFLPDEYRKYEEKRAFDKNRDVIFYEMPLWNQGMKKVPKEDWRCIWQALSELIDKKENVNMEQYDKLLTYSAEKYTIAYRLGCPNVKYESDIYLLQILEGNEPNLDELLDRKYDCEEVEELQNLSSKCYPDYYTYEFDCWKEVEKDDMANLALTEEEVKILQEVQFPFFVSGLAGSGKSTILYYLYANIYKYVALNYPEHKLLFLSYNEDLVEKARRSVKSILCNHSSNEGFGGKDYFKQEDKERHFRLSFMSFRDFLKSTFLDMDGLSKFSDDKHITYEKFRDLYKKENKDNRKRLSPSILWSVIRTFIKGRSLDYFTPEDYDSDAIVRGDRTVAPEVYKEAYGIWNRWYRHYYEDRGYWDDLDLVRYALTKGDTQKVFHSYSVIFCDEAQDFTKLEIDLILTLSKHSEYKLSANPEDKRIPIAFAGDPNQTISPTGFRWAGTKAIFNEAFKESLDSYPKLSAPELSKNYRSQLGIVKFANTIQTIRYNYFDEASTGHKLQSVRENPKGENKDALEYVGFYSYDKYKDIIIKNLQNANIITSGDGEEGDIEDFPEIAGKDLKLSTAIGTKGLEYEAVMLYKFCSDTAYKSFQKIVNEEPIEDASERFEAAHFFTKLYIAVSRAKSQLFIVDTEESYEKFWKYFTDHELWKQLINNQGVRDEEEKRQLVGHITLGDIETLPSRLSDSYDAEANGRQEFERGKSEQSVQHMKRARSYFLEAELTARADECEAYLFLFNNEFEKAGDKFLSLNQKDNKAIAEEAFWKGRCWGKLVNVIQRGSAKGENTIKLLAAKFMTDRVSSSDFVKHLSRNRADFQITVTKDVDIWKIVFEKLSKDLRLLQPIQITNDLTKELQLISKYIPWFDNGMANLRADLYFNHAEFNNEGFSKSDEGFSSENYDKAIEIWEEIGATQNNKDYFKAKKVVCKSVSEEIKWMDKLNEGDEILSKFGDNTIAPMLNEDAEKIVFQHLLSKDYKRAVVYPYPKDAQTKWGRLYLQDKGKFLVDVVLTDFTPEKFYFFEEKCFSDENSIFQSHLPEMVFDEIFSLTKCDEKGRPYWTYFASLKNENGDNLFKMNIDNRKHILDSLSKVILSVEEYDKNYASCFLEMLFDKEYNVKRSDYYVKTVVRIFSRDVFFKEDFRMNAERNKYFTAYRKLDKDEHDRIKDNVRKFVSYKIEHCKKITKASVEEYKALFRAYEICVAYQGVSPDYTCICKMYQKCKTKKNLAELKGWIGLRMLVNQLADDAMMQKASYNKLIGELDKSKCGINTFISDLSKEDASMFIAAVNSNSEEYSYDCTLITSRLIYEHRLRRDNVKSYCRANDLANKLVDYIDLAMDELLSNKGRLDEYAVKILAYTWEAFYEHPFAANHYNNLVKRPRFARLRILSEYLKKRALLHYSYLKDSLFKEKQEDYGVQMTKDYLPASYPKIERKDKVESGTFGGRSKASLPSDNTKEKEVLAQEKNEIVDPAAKLVCEEIARNMKRNNMPVELILQCVSQLTREEIEKL